MNELEVEAGLEQRGVAQPARAEESRERLVEVGQVPGVEDDALRVGFHVPDPERELERVSHASSLPEAAPPRERRR